MEIGKRQAYLINLARRIDVCMNQFINFSYFTVVIT